MPAAASTASSTLSAQQIKRVRTLIEALARAVHCGQVLAAQRKGGADRFYGLEGLDLAGAQALRKHGETLAACASETLGGWRDGAADGLIDQAVAALQGAPDADRPGLPFHALRKLLEARLKPAQHAGAACVALLAQLALQVDRDGDWLQDLMAACLALDLPVNLTQLGLPGEDGDLLALGKTLAPACAAAPFGTSPGEWQVALKKIELWGEKNSGRRDKKVLARELLADPEIEPLRAKLKALPATRVAFFGHSMTMSLHWTTHASWCDLASEVRQLVQPSFTYADFQEGGLNPTRALLNGLADRAVAYAADETYLLMAIRDHSDCDSLRTIVTRLAEAGSRVHLVDDVRPWPDQGLSQLPGRYEYFGSLARETGQVYLDFQRRCMALPETERESWRPLGGDIHMYTPGHIFYAKELLRHWTR